MSFAEPGQVIRVEGDIATVVSDGVPMSAALSLVRARGVEISCGDWVLIALGLVFDRIPADEGMKLTAAIAGLDRETR